MARPRVCTEARSGCLQAVPQLANTEQGSYLPPLIMNWDKGTLSPLVLSEISNHFVTDLEPLSSAVPSGTTDGK